ncbi:uncharacterized protein A4U43_C08F12770 [Asparagus officinalis]|nr:uncharacterized protein A4U43_C08F12770 [Asparagus officinalis]
MIIKKSEAAIHILSEKDMPRYVHEEIKQEPRKMKAKREEEVDSESSLRKKIVKKEERSHSTVALLQIGRKDEAEKEDDQGQEIEKVKDNRADMDIELEEPKEVKVNKVVTEKRKGRKRREESDKTLGVNDVPLIEWSFDSSVESLRTVPQKVLNMKDGASRFDLAT